MEDGEKGSMASFYREPWSDSIVTHHGTIPLGRRVDASFGPFPRTLIPQVAAIGGLLAFLRGWIVS